MIDEERVRQQIAELRASDDPRAKMVLRALDKTRRHIIATLVHTLKTEGGTP